MAYSINQMIVDGKQLVVALDWSYANAEGTLSNQHKLLKPYGSTPIAEVTEDIAIGWLKEQLQNTSKEFDAAIHQRKQETEYAQTLMPYVSNGAGAFQVYVAPEPEEEEEESSRRRAHNSDGTFAANDPSTTENEAWETE